MDGTQVTGGGPAPFLLKTYDMVDDSSTDEIVSWSSNRNSFVVWNPPEFARVLLPTYFKHNNFSSFIRQLNTYGFRKIDSERCEFGNEDFVKDRKHLLRNIHRQKHPSTATASLTLRGFRKIDSERWEFANEDFVKDRKHLLSNIHRRKPIHSHSIPQVSTIDPERAAFEEEIDKLSREKTSLEAKLSEYRNLQFSPKLHLEDLRKRIESMELRQDNLLSILNKAVQNHDFIELLTQKLESVDFTTYKKKRRLPETDDPHSIPEDSFIDNHGTCTLDFGNLFHQDFSNKLRLELSPAISDINLVSRSTQSSDEDGGSPQRRASEGFARNLQKPSSTGLFSPETLELADTGASFSFNADLSISHKSNSIRQSSNAIEEPEGLVSCHLNLTLASSSVEVSKIESAVKVPHLGGQFEKASEQLSTSHFIVSGIRDPENLRNGNAYVSSLNEVMRNDGAGNTLGRVNDVFWEQFLTERPGCSESEEGGLNSNGRPCERQGDGRPGSGTSSSIRNVEHLTL